MPATAVALWFLLALTRAPEASPKADTTPPKPIPSAAATLDAIDRILSNPQTESARAEYPLILDFAQRSDKVEIVLGRPFFEFSGDKRLDASLLAYYLAGAVKFDLAHPAQASDPRADVPDAVRAALVFYRKYRAAHPDTHSALFDHLDQVEREGALDAFVREAPPASPR